MNNPKFNYGDKVRFNLTLQTGTVECIGTIEIIDRYGTFEQNEEPSYDIMVNNFLSGNKPCLVKHIRESSIIKED